MWAKICKKVSKARCCLSVDLISISFHYLIVVFGIQGDILLCLSLNLNMHHPTLHVIILDCMAACCNPLYLPNMPQYVSTLLSKKIALTQNSLNLIYIIVF